jgi:hypothetical protein
MVNRGLAIALLCLAFGARAELLGCGGVGADARRDAASQPSSKANLSLEFFIDRQGAYVADVEVSVKAAGPGGEATKFTTDGPICYLAVPPGRYTVEAIYHGATRTAGANIPAAAHKPVRVAIAFPASVEKDEGIRATPEEKEQAKRP